MPSQYYRLSTVGKNSIKPMSSPIITMPLDEMEDIKIEGSGLSFLGDKLDKLLVKPKPKLKNIHFK
tara:strand:+ start:246 stop:443 length:198 start_codon:yes stop_codon:yes gene_type:complete